MSWFLLSSLVFDAVVFCLRRRRLQRKLLTSQWRRTLQSSTAYVHARERVADVVGGMAAVWVSRRPTGGIRVNVKECMFMGAQLHLRAFLTQSR